MTHLNPPSWIGFGQLLEARCWPESTEAISTLVGQFPNFERSIQDLPANKAEPVESTLFRER